jgi:hypothetical protein
MNGKIAAWVIFMVQGSISLNASVLTVTTLANTGAGSLRNQIAASGVGDTIQFGVNGTILLSSSITISHALIVQGPGASKLVVDANHVDRAFITAAGADVFLSGMTITNGYVVGATGADGAVGQDGMPGANNAYGGAILDQGNLLVLSNCWLVGNLAQGGQGGRGGSNVIGGAYFKPGDGGAGSGASGGAVYSSGNEVRVYNCTFSGNRAVGGAGGTGGVNVAASTGFGGTGGDGGSAEGGATFIDPTPVGGFTNCTFSGNIAVGGIGGVGGNNIIGGGGGTGGTGGQSAGGALAGVYVENFMCCTIVSNLALAGAAGPGGSGVPTGQTGVSGQGFGGGLSIYIISCNNKIANTIVADNFASTQMTNYSAGFNDLGYNFIGSDDIVFCPWDATSIVGAIAAPLHPHLAPLAQNGGGIPTHATTLTSPVTDAGASLGLATDERGAPRPYDFSSIPNAPFGDGSDIGAFELGSADLGLGTSSNNLVISWPAYYGDFILQTATNLQGSNSWSTAPNVPVITGNLFVVTNRMTNASEFYRLVNY